MSTRINSRSRNTHAERQRRLWKRAQKLANTSHPADADVKSTMATIQPPPRKTVREMLLEVILREAFQEYDQWIFDGSIRDLAECGLDDKKQRDLSYLNACMLSFVRDGILTVLDKQKGRRTRYALNLQ